VTGTAFSPKLGVFSKHSRFGGRSWWAPVFPALPVFPQNMQWPHRWSRACFSQQIPSHPSHSTFKSKWKRLLLVKQMSKHVRGEVWQAVEQAGWKLLQVPAAETAVNRAFLIEREQRARSGPELLLP